MNRIASAPRGRFITLEGIDGAGKSTFVDYIVEVVNARGLMVSQSREPGSTAVGEKLRELLLHYPLDACTQTLMAFAARREHVCEVIAPALEHGEWVVCDRFTDATYAYQGAGHGVPWETIAQLERWVQTPPPPPPRRGTAQNTSNATNDTHAPLLEPDLTLWFDVPPEVAAQRLKDAREPDRFESQNLAFFARVAAGYARRTQEAPQRIVRIDANADIDTVRERVLAALLPHLPEKKSPHAL